MQLLEIPGFAAVVDHFGAWPTFHDAILEELTFRPDASVLLRIKTWLTRSEVDERGYYLTSKHATIEFVLHKPLAVELFGTDLNAGTILFGLSLSREGSAYRIQLDTVLGLGGWLSTAELSICLIQTQTATQSQ